MAVMYIQYGSYLLDASSQ